MVLNLRQTQTLSPQMIQSIKVLQMGTMELREYLYEQLQENPTLETDVPAPPVSPNQRTNPASLVQRLEWIHSTDVQNGWYNRDDVRNYWELIPDSTGTDLSEESLYDHLRAQIHFQELTPVMSTAVKYVLQSLNGIGRLDEPLEDLAAYAGISPAIMFQALQLVQALEPAGVAARNLSECLCLQLLRRGETGLPLTIARDYLEDMGQSHYNHIAQSTGARRESVQAACHRIRSLDPRPGASYAPRESPGYIIPDLTVVAGPDGFEVVSNDACLPALHISAHYCHLLESTDDAEVRDYLSGKVHHAKLLIQNVEQRKATLLSCAHCVVYRQADFFRLGPGHLLPLSLADVAAELGIHESTISRAIRHKYLQCSYGAFPMKHFFSRALSVVDGESDVSTEQAKTALRMLIDGEDKKKPLSDQKLSELLALQGIQLSRRTVAKYRDELGTPSTSGRKTYK